MKTRTDLLNHLATKHNLKRYLEIGLQSAAQNFDKIQCDYKVSVDPDPNAHATFCMTSDQYFDEINKLREQSFPADKVKEVTTYDLCFLDGEHSEEQLEIDFYNALKLISFGGFICMHDTSPESEELTHFPRDKRGPWNGSAYKFAARLKSSQYFTVAIDHGVSVFRKVEGAPLIKSNEVMTWQCFNEHRKELLNLVSWEEFVSR